MLSRTVVAASAIVSVMAEGVDLLNMGGDKDKKDETVEDPIVPNAKLDSTEQVVTDLILKAENENLDEADGDSLLKAIAELNSLDAVEEVAETPEQPVVAQPVPAIEA